MKYFSQFFIVTIIAVLISSCGTSTKQQQNISSQLQNGDIIFQTSLSRQSKAIQDATGSRYSHMGIIYKDNGQFYVYEAVQPVKLTPLQQWVQRGEKHHFVVKRLKSANRLLTPGALAKMRKIGEQFMGKDYDSYFAWSNKQIYCSGLVWKIYKEALDVEIGQLQTLADFDLSGHLTSKIMQERYGENPPVNELVISPAAMYKSSELETVMKR